MPVDKDKKTLKENCPHIVVGTPGRILGLVRAKALDLKKVKHFVLDECDKMLDQLDMRRDVQDIFRQTPHEKQVMMFSATLSKECRGVCKKFMQDPLEGKEHYPMRSTYIATSVLKHVSICSLTLIIVQFSLMMKPNSLFMVFNNTSPN